jgi:hypothetical protein
MHVDILHRMVPTVVGPKVLLHQALSTSRISTVLIEGY